MDLALDYFNELKETEDFKRIIELKKKIDEKYKEEIYNFKRMEELYNESKDNKYYPDKDNIKKKFIEAKAILYSKEEVKEYFIIQNRLDDILKKDFDEIRKNISKELLNNNHCKK